MLDTEIHVDTPEGVHLRLVAAGPMVRLLAFGADLLVKAALFLAASLVAQWALGDIGQGFMLITTFVLLWVYPVVFEVFRHGRTPGKAAFGIKVIHRDGTPIDWGSSVIRNLLRVADFLPALYVAGFLSMLFSRGFERLGDHAAGTLVVYEESRKPTKWSPQIEPVPLPVRLSLAEQRALIRFAHRSRDLSAERRAELALLAAPVLTQGRSGPDAIHKLEGMAAWLVGRRPPGVKP